MQKQRHDLQRLISYTKMSGLGGWQQEHELRLPVPCRSLLRCHRYSCSHQDGEWGVRSTLEASALVPVPSGRR